MTVFEWYLLGCFIAFILQLLRAIIHANYVRKLDLFFMILFTFSSWIIVVFFIMYEFKRLCLGKQK